MRSEVELPLNGFVAAATRVGHKFVRITVLFGVEYAWMQEPSGRLYLHARPFDV